MPEQPVLRAQVTAYAKINLDLRILAREESGFHQIETIFQRISLADVVTVTIDVGAGITLQCTPPVDVPDEQNLAWRAAAVYRSVAAWPTDAQRIAVSIEKQIPTGGGLGGGSADAGAVLRALNVLNPRPLSIDRLLSLAATLGADVPFMASQCATALAWGRGERLLALASPPSRRVQLALFTTGVNTAAAYRELAAARLDGRVAPHGSALRVARDLAAWTELRQTSANDFEQPVFSLRPDIASVHASWSAAAPHALVRLSGSGATVYAIGATDADARALTRCAAQWSSNGAIRLAQASTMEQVPAVSIL